MGKKNRKKRYIGFTSEDSTTFCNAKNIDSIHIFKGTLKEEDFDDDTIPEDSPTEFILTLKSKSGYTNSIVLEVSQEYPESFIKNGFYYTVVDFCSLSPIDGMFVLDPSIQNNCSYDSIGDNSETLTFFGNFIKGKI